MFFQETLFINKIIVNENDMLLYNYILDKCDYFTYYIKHKIEYLFSS